MNTPASIKRIETWGDASSQCRDNRMNHPASIKRIETCRWPSCFRQPFWAWMTPPLLRGLKRYTKYYGEQAPSSSMNDPASIKRIETPQDVAKCGRVACRMESPRLYIVPECMSKGLRGLKLYGLDVQRVTVPSMNHPASTWSPNGLWGD